MKHIRKILAIIMVMVMLLSTATVLTFGITAEEPEQDSSESVTPAPVLSIDLASLVTEANVKILYGVYFENITDVQNVELFIWDTVPESRDYTDGSQNYTITSPAYIPYEGKNYLAFEFDKLGADKMTDYYYAVAHYTAADGSETYSEPLKYSVLEYAYLALGKSDGKPLVSDSVVKVINAMLNYGAAMQEYTGHNVETLANGDFSYIKAENAEFADGYGYGIFPVNSTQPLSAVIPEGKQVHNWFKDGEWLKNSTGSYAIENTINVTAPATSGETVTYSADFAGISKDHGSFVYELNTKLPADVGAYLDDVSVDGVMDDAYKVNGIHLPSAYRNADNGSTFDVYFTADSENIYVFYDFHRETPIRYDKDYPLYLYHQDCVDFCFRLDGEETFNSTTDEFHILGGVEGGVEEAVVNGNPLNKGVGDYYVKKDANGCDYTVEFTIPLSDVETDENGNKTISFTAVATMCWEGERDYDGSPNRVYPVAHKRFGPEEKAKPSLLVIKNEGYEKEAATEPTSTNENGNYEYQITNTVLGDVVVDGIREKNYENGIHQTGEYDLVSSGSTFDVYFTAHRDHIYVLYEFVKCEPIFYDKDYGSKHHFDCVDFVLDLAGQGSKSTEVRMYAYQEGRYTDLASKGIDEYYVRHTYNGYNVEFSIPLSKVTSGANGNKTISFTACSTVTASVTTNAEGKVTAASMKYTTSQNSGKIGGLNGAKDHPNYLTVVDSPKTEDGRYTFTLNAGKEALAVDGDKDEAYESGLSWNACYDLTINSSVKKWFTNPEANTFTFYMAADANFVYCLYEIKDENIVGRNDASAWYRADCAEFTIDVNAGTNGKAIRIFGNIEGEKGTIDTDANIPCMTEIRVKKTADGYNVEFKLDRGQFADADVFSFLANIGACATDKTVNNGGSTTCYPAIINTAKKGGSNEAKAKVNEIVIVDAQ